MPQAHHPLTFINYDFIVSLHILMPARHLIVFNAYKHIRFSVIFFSKKFKFSANYFSHKQEQPGYEQ